MGAQAPVNPVQPTRMDRLRAARDSFNDGVQAANHHSSLPYINVVNATADGFNSALDKTVHAFIEGRSMDGGAGVVEMIGSLTPMLGVLGGPAGAAAGGLISLALGVVSAILGAFEPQRKSLATEIKEELRHLRAQEIHDELVAALGDLERAAGPMKAVRDNSRTWEQMQGGWINMFEGNAAHQLNLTKSWLEKAENQENPEWGMIFECYWHVTMLRLQVFALMVTKLMTGFDLRLMPDVNAASDLPESGKKLVIVADVQKVLHFRIFDAEGETVVDVQETQLSDKAQPIAELKSQLGTLWKSPELSRQERDSVVTQVTSIVRQTLRDDEDGLAVGGIALRDRKERDQEFARQLQQVALNKGTLWHLGGRTVFERDSIVSGKGYKEIAGGRDRLIVGPVTRRLYALDREQGEVWVRDRASNKWSVCFKPDGGATDLWVMPEPSAKPNGKAGERVVVVSKSGDRLESKLTAGHVNYAVGTTSLSERNIRQFRSIEGSDGKTYYLCLGQKGHIFLGFAGADGNPLGSFLTVRLLIDLGENLLGLEVGRDEQLGVNQVAAYSEKTLRRRKFAPGVKWSHTNPDGYPVDDAHNWLPVELPPVARGRRLNALAASQTGQLLAAIDRKLWVYMPTARKDDGGWAWGWKEETNGEMDGLREEPIQGFDAYREFLKDVG